MRHLMTNLSLLCAFWLTTAHAAPAPKPPPLRLQIGIGSDFVCLLGSADPDADPPHTRLKCWGIDGSPWVSDRVPERIDGIAVYGSTVCSLDEGDVWCWGRTDDGTKFGHQVVNAFEALGSLRRIAAGPEGFCALTDDGKSLCLDPDNLASPVAEKHGNESVELAVGDRLACTIGEEGPPTCWSTGWGKCDPPSAPAHFEVRYADNDIWATLLSASPGGDATGCRVCALNDGDEDSMASKLSCWGGPASEQRADFSAGLKRPKRVAQLTLDEMYGATTPCVIDQGAVRCRLSDAGFSVLPFYADLSGVIALAGGNRSHCAAGTDYLKCRFRYGYEANQYKDLFVPHALWFQPDLDYLPEDLRQIGSRVVGGKADLFLAAAALLEKESPTESDRTRRSLFVLYVLKPLIDSTDTDWMKQAIGPDWTAAIAQYSQSSGLKSLQAIPRDEALNLASLRLLHTAFGIAEATYTDPKLHDALEAANGPLGMAEAAPGDAARWSALQKALDAVLQAFPDPVATDRSAWVLQLIRDLGAYAHQPAAAVN